MPGLFPLRMLHISRMFSFTTVAYPTNRIPYDWFISQEFVSLTNIILYDCFVPHEFVSSRMFVWMRSIANVHSFTNAFFLCENVPFRNAFYSSVPLRNAFYSSVSLRNAFYSTKMFICEWVILWFMTSQKNPYNIFVSLEASLPSCGLFVQTSVRFSASCVRLPNAYATVVCLRAAD